MVTWFMNLRVLFKGKIILQFRTIIIRCKRIGYNFIVMRQSACLGFSSPEPLGSQGELIGWP